MNPFTLWTEIWLKSSQKMLEALQDPAAKARAPTVGAVPPAPADAPKPAPRKKARKPRVKAKAKAKGKRKARR